MIAFAITENGTDGETNDMLTLASRVTFEDNDNHQAVVHVQTKRCFYSVAIQKGGENVKVFGPGIEEEIDLPSEMIEALNWEGLAILAVLMIEETDNG